MLQSFQGIQGVRLAEKIRLRRVCLDAFQEEFSFFQYDDTNACAWNFMGF